MRRRARSGTSIKDVAAKAAVSVGTVSRVINRRHDVDQELRRRVEEAMRELRYQPDLRARTFMRGQSPIIAFLLANPGRLNPVHTLILHGVEEQCSQNGFYVLFARYQYPFTPGGVPLQLPDLLQTRGLAGCVVAVGYLHENLLKALDSTGLRYVLLANDVIGGPERKAVNQVRYEDFGGAADATRYLFQLGHKDIWFIGDSSESWLRSRLAGYEMAMHEAGLEPRAQTVALSDDPFENGQAAVSLLLDQDSGVTAVLAGSDELAYGVKEGFRRHNREIPRTASLIGFEHHAGNSRQANITSICVDMVEVGRQLARMAMARSRSSNQTEVFPEVVVPATLVRRGSCRPYRPEQAMVL